MHRTLQQIRVISQAALTSDVQQVLNFGMGLLSIILAVSSRRFTVSNLKLLQYCPVQAKARRPAFQLKDYVPPSVHVALLKRTAVSDER
ncbi:hypothetical protein M514_06272 [Trichuris suis]|uniref:Uncharacterized protein n=1 Tax=Trichuris suis TaxID=68888 RepID=A0A085NR44_9BILA|nr:hypothetical protein M513_06272 [Trichuris suis]KFD71940.1 hypothetical protein M514_06272 [Trichuris suis]